MTNTKQRLTRSTGLLLAALMLLGTVLPAVSGDRQSGGKLPDQIPYIMNAGVTIKTQKAADSIKDGIRGIDVSKYQGDINWKKVARDNVKFAIIRASYGTTNDPKFVTNAKEAHANGLGVGAYHYATFTDTASMRKEAAHFISRLKKVNITYPVVLDLESATHKKMKKSTLTNLAIQFMEIVKAEGYDVMLYSYQNFIKDHLDVAKLSGYDLWVANYLEQPTSFNHKMWQHTSYGVVSGISGRVDINIAYSGIAANTQSQSGAKKIQVDKQISNQIKATLNERYNVGLPAEGLKMAEMNAAITKGLQREINAQWGVNLSVDGSMTREAVNYLAEVKFGSGTKGNITYLLQAKLFYKGMYTGPLTGQFDDQTVAAIKAFQKDNGLDATGKLTSVTLHQLLL